LKQKIQEGELQQLVNYLNGLHQSFQKTVVDDELENTEMRKLNYIFLNILLEKKMVLI
jgi:5-methylthioribose kinase